MKSDMVALDLPREVARRIAKWAVRANGDPDQNVVLEAFREALRRKHSDLGDYTGFCARCGTDLSEASGLPGACSGGADL